MFGRLLVTLTLGVGLIQPPLAASELSQDELRMKERLTALGRGKGSVADFRIEGMDGGMVLFTTFEITGGGVIRQRTHRLEPRPSSPRKEWSVTDEEIRALLRDLVAKQYWTFGGTRFIPDADAFRFRFHYKGLPPVDYSCDAHEYQQSPHRAAIRSVLMAFVSAQAGGNFPNRLHASLGVTETAVSDSRALRLTLSVANVSGVPMTIDPWPGNWFVQVFDEDRKVIQPAARAGDVLRPLPQPHTLLPDKRWSTKVVGLTRTSGLPGSTPDWAYAPLKPGTYWLSAVYTAKADARHPTMWSGTLATEDVKIEVLPSVDRLLTTRTDLLAIRQVVPVKDSLAMPLKKYLPRYRFYMTRFQTTYHEYPFVNAVVAVDRAEPKKMYHCFAINFTAAPSQEFLNLFLDALLGDKKTALEAMWVIAGLLSSTMSVEADGVDGRPGPMISHPLDHDGYIELLWNGGVYKHLAFTFSPDWKLSRLAVMEPATADE